MVITQEAFDKTLGILPGRISRLILDNYARYNWLIFKPGMRLKALKYHNFLNESQWWNREKLERYQMAQLRQMLRYAYSNIEYYSKLFRKLKLLPEDIKTIGDLKRIPILTREGVINNFDNLINKRIKKKYFVVNFTSGSTGMPMRFILDSRFFFQRSAFLMRECDWMGVKPFNRNIRLWSRPFIQNNIKDICCYDLGKNSMSLSASPVFSDDLLEDYLELIKKFRPVYVIGNPSAMYRLACYAKEKKINDVRFRRFKSVFETIHDYQKEAIAAQFSCDIFNCYSNEEGNIRAFNCSKYKGLHLSVEGNIVEIAGSDNEVLDHGKVGRIITTSFNNYIMPLLRYETGDLGSLSEEPCLCGRGLPLLRSLDGRANNVIHYKGKYIYPAMLSFVISEFKNIKECQFIQEKENEIKVNIVKRNTYSVNDTNDIIKRLKQVINADLNIKIEFLDHIPRTKMGKFSFVLINIKRAGL